LTKRDGHVYGHQVRKALPITAATLALALSAAVAPAAAPPPKITAKNASVTEGSTSTALFSVRLNKKATKAVTVSFATADGTAMAGSDYTATKGKVTIAKGKTSGRIRVHIIDDNVEEPTETFVVKLSHPKGATLKTKSVTGTIFDDDVAPAGD
jgi:Calx-beta domain